MDPISIGAGAALAGTSAGTSIVGAIVAIATVVTGAVSGIFIAERLGNKSNPDTSPSSSPPAYPSAKDAVVKYEQVRPECIMQEKDPPKQLRERVVNPFPTKKDKSQEAGDVVHLTTRRSQENPKVEIRFEVKDRKLTHDQKVLLSRVLNRRERPYQVKPPYIIADFLENQLNNDENASRVLSDEVNSPIILDAPLEPRPESKKVKVFAVPYMRISKLVVSVYDLHEMQIKEGVALPVRILEPDAEGSNQSCYSNMAKVDDFFFLKMNRYILLPTATEFNKLIYEVNLRSITRVQEEHNNAAWYKNERVVKFGTVDWKEYNFSEEECLDTVAHEFSHGFKDDYGFFKSEFQSGALSESMSDIFAAMTQQYQMNHKVEEAKWLFCEGQLKGKKACRSLLAPGTAYHGDPQPNHMSNYQNAPYSQDKGKIHVNCGIPSRAFVEAALKIDAGGYSWETTGQIWMHALFKTRDSANETFSSFAKKTVDVAKTLYSGNISDLVAKSWALVGVNPD